MLSKQANKKGFVDLGEKPEMGEGISIAAESQPYYPSFHVSKNLKSDLEAGQEIEAVVKLKVRRVTEEHHEKGSRMDYSFDVLGIKL